MASNHVVVSRETAKSVSSEFWEGAGSTQLNDFDKPANIVPRTLSGLCILSASLKGIDVYWNFYEDWNILNVVFYLLE